ncbi:MAG: hypothetical protein Q8K75_01290 [Chlamydiales bacterium]|nr:hypothetical protein [Chlamydiales bacterium]
MIELSPDTAFLLYLGCTLVVLLGTWTYHVFRAGRRKLIIQEHQLQTCEYCAFAYLATRGVQISRCPQCKSLNK